MNIDINTGLEYDDELQLIDETETYPTDEEDTNPEFIYF